MARIYVFPDGGGWSVRHENGAPGVVISTHCRQEDAVAYARALASGEHAEVIVLEDSRARVRSEI